MSAWAVRICLSFPGQCSLELVLCMFSTLRWIACWDTELLLAPQCFINLSHLWRSPLTTTAPLHRRCRPSKSPQMRHIHRGRYQRSLQAMFLEMMRYTAAANAPLSCEASCTSCPLLELVIGGTTRLANPTNSKVIRLCTPHSGHTSRLVFVLLMSTRITRLHAGRPPT